MRRAPSSYQWVGGAPSSLLGQAGQGELGSAGRTIWLDALQPSWRVPLQRHLLPQAVADACGP